MNAPSLSAIGRLRTPFATLAECPRNGRQGEPPLCHAELFAPFQEGLLGLDGFSHLIALYWLDRAPPPSMMIVPPFHGAARGVFATRAPCRPNPIGLSVVAFEGMDETGRLRLRYLDCVDGTPLLDLKPYLPSTDSEPEATMGWLAPYVTQRR